MLTFRDNDHSKITNRRRSVRIAAICVFFVKMRLVSSIHLAMQRDSFKRLKNVGLTQLSAQFLPSGSERTYLSFW